MKTIGLYLLLLNSLLFIPGCVIDDAFDCEHGRGDVETESFTLNDFTEIKLRTDATVFLTQGDGHSVDLVAQRNIADEIDFKIRGGTLIIDTDKCIKRHDDIEIFIVVPEVRGLSVSGSGRIISEGAFNVIDLDLDVSGSGRIDLEINADDVSTNVSGSGRIYLEGAGDDLDVTISGSGRFEGFDLVMQNANIRISGSGRAEVYVEEFLDVRISGSGDVLFKGSPRVESKISGSGRVIDAN